MKYKKYMGVGGGGVEKKITLKESLPGRKKKKINRI